MSRTKAIVDSIQAGDEMKKTLGLIQGGVSSVTVRLQRVIDETDPADYPILLAVLSMSAKSFRQTLPAEAQTLARLLETMTTSIAVTLPEDMKRKAGGE